MVETDKRSEAGMTFDEIKYRVLRLIELNPGILRPRIAVNVFGEASSPKEQEANERVVRKAIASLIKSDKAIYSPGKGFYYKPSKEICERAIAIMKKTLTTQWEKAKNLERLTGIRFTEQLQLEIMGVPNGTVHNNEGQS